MLPSLSKPYVVEETNADAFGKEWNDNSIKIDVSFSKMHTNIRIGKCEKSKDFSIGNEAVFEARSINPEKEVLNVTKVHFLYLYSNIINYSGGICINIEILWNIICLIIKAIAKPKFFNQIVLYQPIEHSQGSKNGESS
ncbi:hypothetical protein LCA30_21790 [Vibrio harveyi]|uniref:hypothetical protein n=1 Tax=Vibrio harveyi TaxID=669 RepID=UPI0012D753F0|nr:hypothetical protein [Vibrio harveyi]